MKGAASRYVTLDMRGVLKIDVQRAVAEGHFAEEMQGARLLSALLRRRKSVQNETPLAGDSAVSGQEMGDEIDGSDPSQPAP